VEHLARFNCDVLPVSRNEVRTEPVRQEASSLGVGMSVWFADTALCENEPLDRKILEGWKFVRG